MFAKGQVNRMENSNFAVMILTDFPTSARTYAWLLRIALITAAHAVEVSTVKTHINNIYARLAVSNRAQARARYAEIAARMPVSWLSTLFPPPFFWFVPRRPGHSYHLIHTKHEDFRQVWCLDRRGEQPLGTRQLYRRKLAQ